MLELLQKFYSSLPEGAKQAPAAVLLMTALITGWKGYWVFGRTYTEVVTQCDKDKTEIKASRDEFKRIAFNSVGFISERAKESADLNQQTTAAPKATHRPTVAVVHVPVTPVTTEEKKAVEAKPRDAEPATLEKSLEASKKVLKKTDIGNAKAEKPE